MSSAKQASRSGFEKNLGELSAPATFLDRATDPLNSKRKTQSQDWRANSQKNPTAGALPISLPNGGMLVSSTTGEDITERLNYRRRSQDHGIQGPYGYAPYNEHSLLPTSSQALVDPGQTFLGVPLAEIGQRPYLGVHYNPYADPSQYAGLPYNGNGPSHLNGHAGHQQYSDNNQPQYANGPVDGNGPGHLNGHAGHQQDPDNNQPQYANGPVSDNGLSHLNGPDMHHQYFDNNQPQYESHPLNDIVPSHLNGHAGHQQYSNTNQTQYTSARLNNRDPSHRTAQVSQQPFMPTTDTSFSFTAPDHSVGNNAPSEEDFGIHPLDPAFWRMMGSDWPPPPPPTRGPR